MTGGAGSLGRAFVRAVLDDPATTRVAVYSRDEAKHATMATEFGTTTWDHGGRLRFFVGDARDKDRLARAMAGIDTVVHAAALKQVPACEYNVLEAIKTNIGGTTNIVDAAIDAGCVQRVVLISSDKACSPTNVYGTTKLAAEKLITSANAYVGGSGLKFFAVRYGNVFGSRGSVAHAWREQIAAGHKLVITDRRMTRFWFTLGGAVDFVRACLERSRGGEVWIPKLPSFRVDDLRLAIAPLASWEETGMRQGEKLHESMVSEDEAPLTWDCGDVLAICPASDGPLGDRAPFAAMRVPEGFAYRSDINERWLDIAALRGLAARLLGGAI